MAPPCPRANNAARHTRHADHHRGPSSTGAAPLKPVSLSKPELPIVVPPPLVSIPEPQAQAVTAVTQPEVKEAPPPTPAPAPDEPIAAPRFDASYLHNPAPEYPAQSRRRREQGLVTLRVNVSSQGGAVEVLIEHTSGWPLLDQAAVSAVKRWRFVPARRAGDAVAAWVLVPIEFGLHS